MPRPRAADDFEEIRKNMERIKRGPTPPDQGDFAEPPAPQGTCDYCCDIGCSCDGTCAGFGI